MSASTMAQLQADSMAHEMVVMSVIVMAARLAAPKVVRWVWMLGTVMVASSVVLSVPWLVDYLVVR